MVFITYQVADEDGSGNSNPIQDEFLALRVKFEKLEKENKQLIDRNKKLEIDKKQLQDENDQHKVGVHWQRYSDATSSQHKALLHVSKVTELF